MRIGYITSAAPHRHAMLVPSSAPARERSAATSAGRTPPYPHSTIRKPKELNVLPRYMYPKAAGPRYRADTAFTSIDNGTATIWPTARKIVFRRTDRWEL